VRPYPRVLGADSEGGRDGTGTDRRVWRCLRRAGDGDGAPLPGEKHQWVAHSRPSTSSRSRRMAAARELPITRHGGLDEVIRLYCALRWRRRRGRQSPRGGAVENGKDEGGQNGSNAADCPPRREVARIDSGCSVRGTPRHASRSAPTRPAQVAAPPRSRSSPASQDRSPHGRAGEARPARRGRAR
jgi:hypothetical protein